MIEFVVDVDVVVYVVYAACVVEERAGSRRSTQEIAEYRIVEAFVLCSLYSLCTPCIVHTCVMCT